MGFPFMFKYCGMIAVGRLITNVVDAAVPCPVARVSETARVVLEIDLCP